MFSKIFSETRIKIDIELTSPKQITEIYIYSNLYDTNNRTWSKIHSENKFINHSILQ